MKWLSAGLVFVNLSTVCGLLLGMAGNGLDKLSAIFALVAGAAFAVAAYLGTSDTDKPNSRRDAAPDSPGSTSKAIAPQRAQSEVALSKRAQRRLQKNASKPTRPPWRYGKVWLWLVGACFLMFAVRSFCWLLYIDGNQLKIQSPNNLGDLGLHVTLIRNFTSGVALWPDNPIYVYSKLRYPAGMDLFNALLCLVHVDLIRGLVWTGLLASLATFYAFFRWAGAFGVAGFLFNGGMAGFQFLKTLKFLDYQGDKTIAWKSIALSMFVTQRGLLYAIPAGVLLLWHWREKFFPKAPIAGVGDSETQASRIQRSGPLPFWVELSLYASMPLFHVHTFLALTIVLIFLSLFERPSELTFIINVARKDGVTGIGHLISHPAMWPEVFHDAPMRRHIGAVLAAALLPATFLVWLITDHFHAASMLEWHPGWVQESGDFAAPFFRIGPVNFSGSSPVFGWLIQKTWNGAIAPAFQFWLTNFGLWLPLILALIVLCGRRAWKAGWRWGNRPPQDVAFLLPAVAIFLFGLLVKTAPWDWDNLKLMVWGYFLVLPFLWTQLIARWPVDVRVVVCIALFGSGFITLLGGLAANRGGWGFADRTELDALGDAIQQLPVEARFAAYPTFNHPLLLQGRKVALGYPGHLWSQGFADYTRPHNLLNQLMRGAGNWREIARTLRVRYIFWGREEKTNYPASTRPWETTLPLVASGQWGAIYDLGPTGQE